MPTYTSSLGLTLPANGDTGWGSTVNNGVTSLVDSAIAGYASVAITAGNAITLTATNGAADTPRNMMLNITGTLTATGTVTIPARSKLYFIRNNTTGGGGFAVTVTTGSGTTVSIPNGRSMVLLCDGTNVREAVDYAATFAVGGNLGVGTTTPLTKLHVIGQIARVQDTQPAVQLYKDATPTKATRFTFNTAATDAAAIGMWDGAAWNDALVVLNGGDVGIGTTTPAVKLDVVGAGDGGLQYRTGTRTIGIGQTASEASVYWGSTTPLTFFSGSERMRIDSSGNVGIGTTSPGAILHTTKTSAGAATIGAFIQNADNTVGTEIRLGFAANSNLVSADRYGWIGHVNTGGTNGGALTFATTPGGAAATERMRITSIGNVGIGTLNPSGFGAGYTTLALNGSNGSAVEFKLADASYGTITADASSLRMTTPGATALAFVTNTLERMRIDSTGNVHIGGVTPAAGYKLDIYNSASNLVAIRSGGGAIASLELAANGNTVGAGGLNIQQNASSAAFIFNGSAAAMAFGTSGLERMRIGSTGKVLINATTDLSGAGEQFTVDTNTTGFAQFMRQQNNSGYGLGIQGQNSVYFYATGGGIVGIISNNGTTTTYATTSDQRLKTNITDAADAAALIEGIKVRSFDWISDNSHQRYGMVAQELAKVVPEAVHTPVDPNEMMAVDYSKLVPLLVKEITSLRARVAALDTPPH